MDQERSGCRPARAVRNHLPFAFTQGLNVSKAVRGAIRNGPEAADRIDWYNRRVWLDGCDVATEWRQAAAEGRTGVADSNQLKISELARQMVKVAHRNQHHD